jgi:hypothetical protein
VAARGQTEVRDPGDDPTVDDRGDQAAGRRRGH